LPQLRLQFDQGRARCDGTISELQMLITTYNTFVQSHSQVFAGPRHASFRWHSHRAADAAHAAARGCTRPGNASCRRRVPQCTGPATTGCRASRSAFAHTSSALQRFEEPLRAVQAGRDSFHDSSAAHLPGSVVDNLPVRLLLLPLFFFPLQPAATASRPCHSPRSALQRSSSRFKASALKCVPSCSQADAWRRCCRPHCTRQFTPR
jgi:hypothetical protein